MNPIKLTSKTRVKLSSTKIHKYLGLKFWDYDRKSIVFKYMYDNFKMRLTSKRIGVYYFSIIDKPKYSLFLLMHSDLIVGNGNDW